MDRDKELLNILNGLDFFYIDLNRLIADYDRIIYPTKFQFHIPVHGTHNLKNVTHDNKSLYINCTLHDFVYQYSLDGKFIKRSPNLGSLRSIDIVNNELYLLHYKEFRVVDLLAYSVILQWSLPKESNTNVIGYRLKAEQEKIYFTYAYDFHYVYHYYKNGKEIKKYGKLNESNRDGEFNSPAEIGIDEKYLYICDKENDRVQVIDKENGKFIRNFITNQQPLQCPQSILLYDSVIYVGDFRGIQIFSREENICIQILNEKFDCNSLSLFENKLYAVDGDNTRIQVWGC